jgi:electron transfer flavoprotein beta subunit
MRIAVCVKQVPATTSEKRYTADLRLDRAATEAIVNPLDEYAIEQALRLKEAGAADEVVYLTMGPESAAEWVTARVLAAALDRIAPEVSLMGMSSDDARGSLVPGAVAAIRGLPLLAYGSELRLTDGAAQVRRLNPTGFDILEAPLPVVASVTDQVGEPRYASLKGIMAARRLELTTWSLADLGLDPATLTSRSRMIEARPPAAKPPAERITGVGPDEAATRMADWLAARKLIA